MKKFLLLLSAVAITSAAVALPCPTNYIFAQQAGWRLSGDYVGVIGTNFVGTVKVKIKNSPRGVCGFDKVVCKYESCNGVAYATAFAPNITPMPGQESNWVRSGNKLVCGPCAFKDSCRFLINPNCRMGGYGFNGGYGFSRY